MIFTGLLIGSIVAVVPETSYDYAAGRGSGLWNLARVTPKFADRSPLMIALSAWGGAVLAMIALHLARRERWIVVTDMIAFIAAQTANAMAWQRYYEPFILILLALITSIVAPNTNRRFALAGPLILAALLAGVTVMSLKAG